VKLNTDSGLKAKRKMTTQEQLLMNILAKVSANDQLVARNGTIKLNGTAIYNAREFKALAISAAAEITALTDSAGNTRADYFNNTTYTCAAGDIFTPIDSQNGNIFTSVTLASGSAMIIL
jgi:hypothetical protein